MTRFGITSTRRSFLRKTAIMGTALGVFVRAASATETPPGSEPMLLVHGYMDTGDTPWWEVVKSYLVDVGYAEDDIYVLSLGDVLGTTTDSPAEYADAVGARLKSLSEEHGSPVDIVAHSMGGLDSRWCLEKQDGAQYVDDLVTLGTLHQGTYATCLGLMTEGGRDMTPGSTFLERLNDGTLAEGVNNTALWSSADELIVPSEYASLPSPNPRRSTWRETSTPAIRNTSNSCTTGRCSTSTTDC